MISLSISNKEKNFKLNIRENIIEGLKIWMIIKPLQFFFKSKMEKHTSDLENCKKGTVGYEVYRMLEKHKLQVIPKFENHDLKHLLLDYDMSSIDEIKMQMYLLGNGNYSIYCLLFAASGILFPIHWIEFYLNFKKGKNAISILELSIFDCMNMKIEDIKTTYNKA